jgi:hypothetical protein
LIPEPITNAVLVCEGACNPARESLERLVDNDSRPDEKGRLMRGSKVMLLRALVHTPHHRGARRIGYKYNWVCDVCGHERHYG